MPVEELSLPELVESLRLVQQENWQRGVRFLVESAFEQHPRLLTDSSSALQLVYSEILLREGAGERPLLEEYVRRLPQYADQLTPLFEVHQAIESDRLLSAMGEPRSPGDTIPNGDCVAKKPWPKIAGHEILGEVGSGGMGVVFKARQVGLNRIVALKMIRAGSHANAAQQSRFRTEAEAVARLQHPNIVQIHQVGDEEGCPYFSMEFVDGRSLAQELDGTPRPARQAAALIATLARAIHTAHQKGIIHRDLKPANILMSVNRDTERSARATRPSSGSQLTERVPKITDFGLAKILDIDVDQTGSGTVLGTPSYMAPEQANGSQLVGPATDVYSLGTILYELLTGRPPFKAQNQLETLRQVLANEPVSLARFDLKVPRDLNTICMKCLQKEPSQRYGTSLELALDLERFLSGQPILARPTSPWEQAWKWARRRPLVAALLATSAAALLALIIVWGTFTVNLDRERVYAAGEARTAEQQRQLAVSSRDRAMTAIDKFLTRLGEDQLGEVPGMDVVRRDLLQDALEMHQGLLKDLDDQDPTLRRQVGLALQRVARIHWWLRERDREEQAYRQAQDIQQKLVTEFPDQVIYRRDLGKSRHHLAVLTRVRRTVPEAEEAFGEALAFRRDLADRYPGDPDFRFDLAQTLFSYSNLYTYSNLRRKEELLRQVLAMQEGILKERPDSLEYLGGMGTTLNDFGALAVRMNDFKKAEGIFRRCLELSERLLALQPEGRGRKESLAGAYGNLAVVYGLQNRLVDALAAYDKAILLRSRLVTDHPAVPTHAQQLGTNYVDRGQILQDLDRWNEARASYVAGFDRFLVLTERYPREWLNGRNLAAAHMGLARVDRQQGRWEEASRHAQSAVTEVERVLKLEPKSVDVRDTAASAYIEHAIDFQIADDTSQAKDSLDRAIKLAEGIRKLNPNYYRTSGILHEAYESRGDMLLRQGQLELACQDWERAAAETDKNAEAAKQAALTIDAMRSLAKGDYQAACSMMDSLRAQVDRQFTFRVAWLYSLAGAAVQRDPMLSNDERTRLRDSYSRRAVENLEHGQRERFFKFNVRRRLLVRDTVLAALRERSDYQELLRRLSSDSP